MERFFIFLYVGDPDIEDLLNLAIYVANPQETWPAHITVAGPYRHRKDTPRRASRVSFADTVHVLGVDRFNNADQCTVYLRTFSQNMSSVWHKPDYPDFNPHLTIYSGSDWKFADCLHHSLASLRPEFTFPIKETLRVRSIKGQRSFGLSSSIKDNLLRNVTPGQTDNIEDLSMDERVSIVRRAICEAQHISAHKYGGTDGQVDCKSIHITC